MVTKGVPASTSIVMQQRLPDSARLFKTLFSKTHGSRVVHAPPSEAIVVNRNYQAIKNVPGMILLAMVVMPSQSPCSSFSGQAAMG